MKIPKTDIPDEILKIIETLNSGGFEAYMVGGCVRDMLMCKTPKDWDVTTSATPPQIKALFQRTFDTGIEHGTVTVVLGKKNFEVTTYRIDGKYLDNRRPSEVFFTDKLTEDLLRRDFTMNAIAYHPDTGYFDPYDGVSDIFDRTIRGVGDADARFKEDGLRMMRAVRFAAQLNFEIEQKTWSAILDNSPLIKNISMERVRDELLKLILSANPMKIALLTESGLMLHIDSELDAALKNPAAALEHLECDAASRLAAIFKGLNDNDLRMKYFRLDNKTARLVQELVKYADGPGVSDFYDVRRLVALVGPEDFTRLILFRLGFAIAAGDAAAQTELREALEKFEIIRERGECVSLKQLALNGADLLALGVPSGESVGEALNILLAHVLQFPDDNTPDALKNVIINWLP